MTVLILLRHAKAVKDDPGGDHARPLSTAGRAAAERAGQCLSPFLPDDILVIASDARRTRQTAELAFPPDTSARIRLEPKLYEARAGTLLDVARGLPASAPAAVLVGHNPSISEFALMLAGQGAEHDLARLAQGLATADAVVLEFAQGWAELAPGSARVLAMLVRKVAED